VFLRSSGLTLIRSEISPESLAGRGWEGAKARQRERERERESTAFASANPSDSSINARRGNPRAESSRGIPPSPSLSLSLSLSLSQTVFLRVLFPLAIVHPASRVAGVPRNRDGTDNRRRRVWNALAVKLSDSKPLPWWKIRTIARHANDAHRTRRGETEGLAGGLFTAVYCRHANAQGTIRYARHVFARCLVNAPRHTEIARPSLGNPEIRR